MNVSSPFFAGLLFAYKTHRKVDLHPKQEDKELVQKYSNYYAFKSQEKIIRKEKALKTANTSEEVDRSLMKVLGEERLFELARKNVTKDGVLDQEAFVKIYMILSLESIYLQKDETGILLYTTEAKLNNLVGSLETSLKHVASNLSASMKSDIQAEIVMLQQSLKKLKELDSEFKSVTEDVTFNSLEDVTVEKAEEFVAQVSKKFNKDFLAAQQDLLNAKNSSVTVSWTS